MVEGAGSRIEGNRVTGAVSQGFHLDGNGLRITGNLAEAVADTSFHIGDGQGSAVTRNRALDAGNTGFQVAQVEAVLTRNVAEGATTGFSLTFFPMTLVAKVAEGSGFAGVASGSSASQYVLVRNRFDAEAWDLVFEF
jgi:hypothetical protein